MGAMGHHLTGEVREERGFFMLSWSRQWGTLGQRSHVSKAIEKKANYQRIWKAFLVYA